MDRTKIILALEYNIIYLKKYWKLTINATIIAGLVGILVHYLQGLFVQHHSHITNYLQIIMVGFVLSSGFTQGFYSAMTHLSIRKRSLVILTYDGFSFKFFQIFFWDLIILTLRVFAFLLFVLTVDISLVNRVLFSFLGALVVLLTSYAYAFFFMPLQSLFRSEGRIITRAILMLNQSLIPIGFLLSSFWFYNYYFIFNSPAILIEELRKMILFNELNISSIFAAIAMAVVYLLLGLAISTKVLQYGKRKSILDLT